MIKKIVRKTDIKFLSFYIFLFAFISCLSITEKSFAQSGESAVPSRESQEEITRGERFFLGLLPFKRTYESCVSCHNLTPVDTLNWNPSAMDIALEICR